MKILPLEFEHKNFFFKQLKRIKNIAIYERWSKNCPKHFEVIIINSHNGYKIKDYEAPPSEFYPNAKEWGIHGWTYMELGEAEKKFKKLLNVR